MTKKAELHDGTIMEFPDATPDHIIQKTVKRHLAGVTKTSQPEPVVSAPQNGLYREPSGQLVFEPGELPDYSRNISGVRQLQTAGRTVMGGLSKLARGTLPISYDISAGLRQAFGLDPSYARERAEQIRRNIPVIPARGLVEEIGQTAVQYGIPQTAAIRGVGGLVSGARAAVRIPSLLATGGAVDILAATPEEKPILPAPKGELPIERKLRIGAEGVVIPAALELPWAMAKGLWRGAKIVGGMIFQPEKAAHKAMSETLQRVTVNPEAALESVYRTLEEVGEEGIRPTLGVASRDPGLIALEKGLATKATTSPMMMQRKVENIEALSDLLERVTRQQGGDPQAAKTFFRSYIDSITTGKKNAVDVAEQALQRNIDETDTLITQFGRQAGKQKEASEFIDSVVRNQLNELTAKKNNLYQSIDPNREVEVSVTRVKDALSDLTKKHSELDTVPNRVPNEIKNTLNKVLYPKKGTPKISYGALEMDLRPRLSKAIQDATDKNDGALAKRLGEFGRTLDKETDFLVESGGDAGERAKKAKRFFEKIYVPRFKKLTGNAFRKAERAKQPIPPSVTARRFLYAGTGISESADQLNKIVARSRDKLQAQDEIRKHLISDIADKMTDSKSQKTIVSALESYLSNRNIRELLSKYPKVNREVLDFYSKTKKGVEIQTQLGKQIKTAREGLAKTEREINQSSLRFFVKHDDPVEAVGSALLKSTNPVREMEQLIKMAKQDKSGQALKGMKSALNKYLDDPDTLSGFLRGTLEYGLKDTIEIRRAGVKRLLQMAKTRKALQLVYSPSEMKTLDKVRKQLDTLNKINMQVTASSSSAPIAEAVMAAKTVLASVYGIVKGRGIYKITDWLLKMTNRDPRLLAEEVLTKAMLDPELGAIMLKEITPANEKIIQTRFIRYVTNNILTGEEKE